MLARPATDGGLPTLQNVRQAGRQADTQTQTERGDNVTETREGGRQKEEGGRWRREEERKKGYKPTEKGREIII